MKISKQDIDNLINNFRSLNKDTFLLDERNLVKFDKANPADKQFRSYIDGYNGGDYYFKFLKYLVEKLQPDTTVELGNREGVSTLCIYDALKKTNGHFYTIDIIKDQRYCPPQMFTDSQVTFIWGDVSSIDTLKKIPFDIDFLFSDTIHFNFQIQDEFDIYQYLLADTALVAIDDIWLNDKGDFFKKITYEKWDLTTLCHTSGWGLFLFKRKEVLSKEERYTLLIEAALHIWERKYNEERNENNIHSTNTLPHQIKSIIKKNKTLYSFYTKMYNRYTFRKKNKKIIA